MSLPANGRYQSQLFNFLNRQSQRLKDRCDRAVRHAKMAATWGVQILLYPVYLTVQATRFAGHQIKQAVQQKWLQLQPSKPASPETPPPVDTPIQEVFKTVESFAIAGVQVQELLEETLPTLPVLEPAVETAAEIVPVTDLETVVPSDEMSLVVSAENELQHQPTLIGGVASLLATRTLVLVTTNNEILDILTPQQQQTLLQQIYWEVAEYGRQLRLVQALQRRFRGRVQTLPEKRSRLLPPARWFWRLMAWVQTSPVAIAANVFQESTLVTTQNLQFVDGEAAIYPPEIFAENNFPEILSEDTLPPLPSEPLPPTSPFEQKLILLDRTVAEIEAHPLESVSELTGAIAHHTQTLVQQLQTKVRNTTLQPQPADLDSSESNTLKINLLIRAAIDYFFGKRSSQLNGNGEQSPASFLGNSKVKTNHLQDQKAATLPSKAKSNSWLAWEDLFLTLDSPLTNAPPDPWTEPIDQAIPVSPPTEVSETTHTPHALPGQVEIPIRTPVWSLVKRRLRFKKAEIQQTSKPAIKHQSPNAIATPSSPKVVNHSEASPHHVASLQDHAFGALAHVEQGTTKPITPRSSKAVLDYIPDWIETKATPTGYVKHPLEQLLEWLDIAMLWLEKLLIKIWQWVKQLG